MNNHDFTAGIFCRFCGTIKGNENEECPDYPEDAYKDLRMWTPLFILSTAVLCILFGIFVVCLSYHL